MSAPISPGDFTAPSETISVTATISRAPLAWQASASLVKSVRLPKKSGFCTTTQEVVSSILPIRSSAPPDAPLGSMRPVTASKSSSLAWVSMTARYIGCRLPDSTALLRRVTRFAITTASAAAVEPSYIEALATSMPVISATWVWNSNRYCSVPWVISGW